ncbi:sensor histidine kinase [Algoriphagus sp.]|uniref:tetratricopeptide repeat-containing sensor histidine kinase n=1 Tax=Algoriphagus sp. TaxID=1872435 RepID=UPI0025D48A39|nr:sensor histidine kinase [Algoriphagus sp.]
MNRILLFTGFLICFLNPFFSALSQVKSAINSKLSELINQYEDLDNSAGLQDSLLLEIIFQAEKEGNFEEMTKRAIEAFRRNNSEIFSYTEKKKLLQKTLSHEDKLIETTTRGELHLKMAGAYFNLEQFDSAIMEYTRAIEIFEPKDSVLIADTYFFRGQGKDYIGDMIGSMKDYQTALNIYESLDDDEYVGYVYGGMAILFSKYEIFNEAEKIRNILIAKDEVDGNNQNLAIQLYNQAEDYQKQGRFEDQLKYLQRANSLTPFEERNLYVEAMIKLSLSNYYGEQGQIEFQRKYFKEAELLAKNNPEIEHTNPTFLHAKALMAKSMGDMTLANQLANESLEAAIESKNMDHLIKAYSILSETYSKLNNPKKALEAIKDQNFYKDSIFTANRATTFSYYQALYETEKKERELLVKTGEIESIKTTNTARLRLVGIGVFFLIAISVSLFLWKNLQHQKKQKELQSKFSQELLKNQEDERIRISKDLHDGLGQSLLLIKNKVALTKDNDAGEMLDTAISELRAIARSLHPMQLEKLGLSKAAEHLLEQIDTETDIFVSSEIEDLKGIIDKKSELQLYRILQESINNVLKHSEASALRVTFQKIGQRVELKIEDNGKGFDFSEKLNDFQSLGLKTLKERISAIEGSMKVISQKGNGTSLIFITYV